MNCTFILGSFINFPILIIAYNLNSKTHRIISLISRNISKFICRSKLTAAINIEIWEFQIKISITSFAHTGTEVTDHINSCAVRFAVTNHYLTRLLLTRESFRHITAAEICYGQIHRRTGFCRIDIKQPEGQTKRLNKACSKHKQCHEHTHYSRRFSFHKNYLFSEKQLRLNCNNKYLKNIIHHIIKITIYLYIKDVNTVLKYFVTILYELKIFKAL